VWARQEIIRDLKIKKGLSEMADRIKVEPISKIGFWFKIAAEPSFKPEAYCCMSRI